MEPTELQATLKAGIAAVRAGDKARGRELLLRVVESDNRSEPAWLWLSAALDEPQNQLVALENVLALNPNHARALAGAQALRQQLGLVAPPPAAPPQRTSQAQAPAASPEETPPPTPAAATPAFVASDPEEDPYQCAYCGRPTEAEATRCPHCSRSLLAPGPWRGGGHLYTVLILAGLQSQSALIQAVGVYGYENFPRFASLLPGPEIWAANAVVPALVRAVLWIVVLLVLLGDWRQRFAVTLVVALADLAWLGAGFGLGLIGPVLAAVSGVLSGGLGLLALAAVVSEAQARVRLKVAPDHNISSADEFDRRATAYARRQQWALAALHWRRAIARRPRQAAFYKSLGMANARLGRTEAAQRAWISGATLDPADPDYPRLLRQHGG